MSDIDQSYRDFHITHSENRFPIDSESWKNVDGKWRTAVFYRTEKPGYGGMYSFEEGRKVFLESSTEYEAAMKFVTSWEHWKAISESAHCKPMIDLWREEKMMQDQTKARKLLWESAEGGNLSAARVIYEAKKEEKINREAQKKQQEVDQHEQDILQNSSAKLISIKAQS